MILVAVWLKRPLPRAIDYLSVQVWFFLACAGIALFILKDNLAIPLWGAHANPVRNWLAALGEFLVVIALTGCLFMWGLGALLWWNQAMDPLSLVTIQASVLEKRVGPGDRLLVEAWQLSPEPIPFAVTHELFQQVQPGDKLRITMGRGALHVPWIREVRRVE